MAARSRRHRTLVTVAALALLVAWALVTTPPAALDPGERKKITDQIQRIVLDNAYYMPGLWWTQNLVHWAKVRNCAAPSNYYSNQKLQDVWLAED